MRLLWLVCVIINLEFTPASAEPQEMGALKARVAGALVGQRGTEPCGEQCRAGVQTAEPLCCQCAFVGRGFLCALILAVLVFDSARSRSM